MDIDYIKSKIPHREPMLLLDSVVELEDRRILCRKQFRENEFFHQGHYPGNPIIPGFILCEAAAQAGAVLAGAKLSPDATPLLTRVNDVKFKQVVRPGDTVDISVTLDEELGNAKYFSAQVKINGKPAVSLTFAVMISKSE